MVIEKAFVKERQKKWYYELYKHDFDAETIVLFHEGLGSVAQWKKWPFLLFEKLKMNVLVYDRTGYGQSSPAPQKYPFDYLRFEAREVFPKIIQHLGIESVHLFGHSDGGTIALLIAAFHPSIAKTVISEAAHVIIEKISVNGIKETKNIYQEKLKRPMSRYHGNKTDWVFYHWANTWLQPNFFHWNMIKELQKIKCPVLAIQGQKDEYGSYEQLKTIKTYCTSQLLFLTDCGHHPHFEQTDKVLQETYKFLSNK